MWQMVRALRERGVTIILTTHYIEEAEEMADRIGIINHGDIVLVEDKAALLAKPGKKQLTLNLQAPLATIPAALSDSPLELSAAGQAFPYTFVAPGEPTGLGHIHHGRAARRERRGQE